LVIWWEDNQSVWARAQANSFNRPLQQQKGESAMNGHAYRGRVEFWIKSMIWTTNSIELQFRRKVNIDFFRSNYFVKLGIINEDRTVSNFRAYPVNCLEIFGDDDELLVNDIGQAQVEETDFFELHLPQAMLATGMIIFIYQMRQGNNYGRKFEI